MYLVIAVLPRTHGTPSLSAEPCRPASPEQVSLRPPSLFRVQATHVTVFLISA